MNTPVTILLATYDGAPWLPAQLGSLAAQTHRDWSLIVSDDGSRDATRAVVEEFARAHPGQVWLIEGPGRGATANFLSLIGAAPEGEALAFCDQDDLWHPEKLARAVEALDGARGAAHYSARTWICGPNLEVLTESPQFRRSYGLRNALVQACTAGNTSVFNAEAAAILRAAAPAADTAGVVAHDWWAYQVIAASGGAILRDDRPALHYRQHGGNEMGRNDTPRAKARRLAMLFDGRFGRWLAANHRSLSDAPVEMPPENRALIDAFGAAIRAPGPLAAARLARLGVYRHEASGTAALLTAAALGRLRP